MKVKVPKVKNNSHQSHLQQFDVN